MMVRSSLLLSLCVALLGCPAPTSTPFKATKGSASGTPTTASIGASGGSLVAGALTLTVPAGALAQNVTVTATQITSTSPGHRGQALRLEPEGTTFSQPVTLTFKYEDSDLNGTSPEALMIAFQHSSGVWAVPGDVTLDTAARTVSVKTTHFSDWSLVSGAQLRPPSANVKVKENVTLVARRCFALPESSAKVEEELAPLWLGFPCDDDKDLTQMPTTTSDWSVNGVAGGSSASGTVSGQLSQGVFSAPASKPSPNVVAVSARVELPKKGKTLVVSNVTINDGSKRVLVSAKYSKEAQVLTAFVTGTVRDEGFQFETSFPVTDGELTVTNVSGGTATSLRDTRSGCLQPTLGGAWDELRATKVTVTGSFFTVDGERSIPAITLGVGEGDCAVDQKTEAARTSTEGLQIGFPTEFFTSTTPPATPVTNTEAGWTFTYTTQP